MRRQADQYLSRIIDYDDWSLDHKLFKFLDNKWGPHTVDRFACFYNAQLSRYNSRFWNPGSEAVDAFTPTLECREQLALSAGVSYYSNC